MNKHEGELDKKVWAFYNQASPDGVVRRMVQQLIEIEDLKTQIEILKTKADRRRK